MAGSALAAFVQFQSVTMAVMVAAVSVVVTGLEGFVLAPLMLGRAARVNTVATFVALMFWGWLWGGVGLVIAVPVLMIVKTIADHVESLAPLSELLAERDAPARPSAADGTRDAKATPGGRRWYERTHVA
jgi:predicted PurR-regulated permease PerM